MKKRVGIVTWHYYKNFGSALQAYALQQSLLGLGCVSDIINYRKIEFGRVNKFKNTIKIFLDNIFFCLFSKHKYNMTYERFHSKYLKQTKIVYDSAKLNPVSKKFDAVICGSDQIWAPNVFNPVYLLDFVADNVKKISYAASIGLNDIPENLVFDYTKNISSFSAVSVREQKGAELLNSLCNIKAEVVLDPTLLIETEKWHMLEKKPFEINEKFVFCYFLNENNNYNQYIKNNPDLSQYKIIGVSKNPKDREWMDVVSDEFGPCEFLWLINNAESVFTDSYHGTVFSLLYHKKFVLFERFSENDSVCQNSRIYQLDSCFDIKNNIVSGNMKDIVPGKIDYENFEIRLNDLRKKSVDFLKKALEEK